MQPLGMANHSRAAVVDVALVLASAALVIAAVIVSW
jgi:hypothetical protein